MLNVRSPPSFAFNSSSTSRFSPICSFAGFFPPPLPPPLDDDGIGGRVPNPFPAAAAVSTFCSAVLLFRLRRRRRLLLAVVLLLELLAIDSVSLSMRSPDRSMCSGLLVRGFVVVTGTGPPGPPRPRLLLLLPPPPPPPLPPRREVLLAAEEGGLLLARLAVSEEDMLKGVCVRVCLLMVVRMD